MKRKIGALEKVEADLPNLQHKIRRDPSSYKDDFANQYSQYQSLLSLFLQSPTTASDSGLVRLGDLIDFISHVAECYPSATSGFASELMQLLELERTNRGGILDADLRDKLVGCLVLLRRKEILDSVALLNCLWPLLVETPSKSFRTLLFQKIVSDLRSSNAKSKNHKLNRSVQQLCYDLIAAAPDSPKGLWAVKLTRELWKRQVWTDAKAVSIMSLAALSENAKGVVGGVRFFLGGDQERDEAAEEESDEGDAPDMFKLRHQHSIKKKSSKNEKALKEAAKKVKRQEKKKQGHQQLNFSALHLLHDPQSFAERLFATHLQPDHPKVKLNLEQKLEVLSLVTRLVGMHKLTLISLYSYFLKYLTPKQPSVTSFLAYLAMACHNLVTPDTLEPLVLKIANEFVSESSAGEVASAGLNAIREICSRQPLGMTDTLLQDLVQYRKSKDKGVQMAARGLLSLYREHNPELLHKRDRGKDAALGLRSGEKQVARFGEVEAGGIAGLDLLEKYKQEQRQLGEGVNEEDEEEKGWDDWDAQSDSSEGSEGWINVESDGEDIDISDSEDEKPANKKAKTVDEIEQPVDLKSADVEKEEDLLVSKYAMTHILTPADLKKLHELRTDAAITANLPAHQRKRLQAQQAANATRKDQDAALSAQDIEGLASLSKKLTKAEKIALAKGDRGDGAKTEMNDHRSTTSRRKDKMRTEGKSTTNKEKARRKNIFMQVGKARRKGKRSLVEQKNVLKAHIDRSKKGGRKGNRNLR
ncbi:SDA1 domain-containing protein [Polychaeton citri CBS 116435]|uniref:Protein SDA1 n=1 Tax=Polychaeton citri CBS 116435 TaxID=1314669 RepID=A0A9P4Q572_9PEZI|nr:SDA1 domain-containing protein [Polychaeton citri CBS 116435]